MKKQHIIIISIIAVIVIIVGCVLLFKGNDSKQNNNFNPQSQNVEQATIESLSVGNWVSVVAEKSNGSYIASMVMACDDKDSCQTSGSGTQNPPTNNNQGGEAPTGNPPTGEIPTGGQAKTDNSSMADKTMLSGTITEVNSDSIVLSLDTGETATILISDSTRINKR